MKTVESKVQYRKLHGIVVSDKMDKTRIVRVERVAVHPKYQKRYKVSTRFAVHDAKNETKVGDTVTIEACSPRSRTKRFRIISKA